MTLPFADYNLGDALLTVLSIFFIVMFIWILIAILSDLFRDHEMNGWVKAAWCFFLIFIPFLTAFIYLIARGQGMRERAIKQAAEMKKHQDEYIREVASSPVDEIAKLHDLKEKGAISADEYEKLKARQVA